MTATWTPEHPLLPAVAGARAAVAEATAANRWSLSDDEVDETLDDLLALRAAVEELTAGLVQEAEARGMWARTGTTDVWRWLRSRYRLTRRETSRLEAVRRAVGSSVVLAEALRAGEVHPEQAVVIGRGLDTLPATTGAEAVAEAAELLVEQAAVLDADELTAVVRHLRETVTVTADVDDPAEAEAVRREAERAAADVHERRELRLTTGPDGMVRLRGALDPVAGALVKAALQDRAEPVPDVDGGPDLRSRSQRLADAFEQLAAEAGTGEQVADPLELLDEEGADLLAALSGEAEGVDRQEEVAAAAASEPTPVGSAVEPLRRAPLATVSVVLHWDLLQRQLPGAGVLEDGTVLTASQALQLCCDATLLPAVLGGRGETLHLGRSRRLHSTAQRRALALRDRGCVFPGCRRPPRGCAAHHMVPWSEGGETTVDGGCLLCPYHHARVHREGWTVRLARNGYPEVVPSTGVDPEQRPRQHLRYRAAASP